jgi:hypothetical protein
VGDAEVGIGGLAHEACVGGTNDDDVGEGGKRRTETFGDESVRAKAGVGGLSDRERDSMFAAGSLWAVVREWQQSAGGVGSCEEIPKGTLVS